MRTERRPTLFGRVRAAFRRLQYQLFETEQPKIAAEWPSRLEPIQPIPLEQIRAAQIEQAEHGARIDAHRDHVYQDTLEELQAKPHPDRLAQKEQTQDEIRNSIVDKLMEKLALESRDDLAERLYASRDASRIRAAIRGVSTQGGPSTERKILAECKKAGIDTSA